MGRSRGFDEEEALAAIMEVFWEHGYEATSLGQLEAATSLVRTSLYNAFGNKAEMFGRALEAYDAMMTARLDAAARGRGVEALGDVFAYIMTPTGARLRQPAGCLMVGAATQHGHVDEAHLEIVRAHRKGLVASVTQILQREKVAGRLSPEVSPAGGAELLVCVMWGALATQCLSPENRSAAEGLEALLAVLRSWVPG